MEVIIRTLKDVAFGDPKNDRALGHLLVLLQYQWPKEEEIFASLITTIQKRRRFYFPEFFEYIICIPTSSNSVYGYICRVSFQNDIVLDWLSVIDILEEILYLANCDSLQITLFPQTDVNKWVCLYNVCACMYVYMDLLSCAQNVHFDNVQTT